MLAYTIILRFLVSVIFLTPKPRAGYEYAPIAKVS